MPRLWALTLDGVAGPVILPDDPDFIEALCRCLQGWPLGLARFAAGDGAALPLCVIEPRGAGRFRAHSRFLDEPLDGLRTASAICAVLADISQAYCNPCNDHVFGLHCGCVTIGTRGVILAGARRAGKSTLVARLSGERGVTVLCDDVLPVTMRGMAVGLGLAPRLRLPLPDGASPGFRADVAQHLGPADGRYGYLLTPALAPHGSLARPEALILLDRRADVTATLHVLPQDEVLRTLVERSIAGPDGPEAVFAAARAMADGLVGLRLVYADIEDAVALLLAAFPADGCEGGVAVAVAAPVAQAQAPLAEGQAATGIAPGTLCRRAPDTATRRIGDAAFLWRPGDAMLWHLNPTAQAIWALLALPADAGTVARDLAEVFPDEPPLRLLNDTCALLARLADEGFVTTGP